MRWAPIRWTSSGSRAWLNGWPRRGGAAAQGGGEDAVASVRALITGGARPPAAAPSAPAQPRAILTGLADAAAGGFAAEIWPHLAEVAEALFPPPPGEPLAPPIAARLGWVAPLAASLEIPRVELLARRGPGGWWSRSIPRRRRCWSIPRPAPTGWPFSAARAVALLALRAGPLDRKPAADLAPLFSCAAVLAGGAVPKKLPKPSEGMLRDVGRFLSRKDRKALMLQASRFGFETLDLEAWRAAVLRVADRFALIVVDDPAGAAVARAGGVAAVAGDAAARELLAFALSETYVAARRAAGRPEGKGA